MQSKKEKAEYMRKWRKENPIKYQQQWIRSNKNKRNRIKKYLIQLKVNGCGLCGYNKYPTILEFHHVEPKYMKFHISALGIKNNKNNDIADEIAKCILLCPTCHREIHFILSKKVNNTK